MDKTQKLREELEKRYEYWREKESNSHSIESEIRMSECQHLLLMLNSLQEEPVSEGLEEAANFYANTHTEWFDTDNNPHVSPAFKAGAKWQKEKMIAKAIDGTARPDDNEIWCNLTSNNLEDGDKVKVIVIKED